MDRNNIPFFQFSISVANSLCFIQDWNIKSSGLQIDLQHSLKMQLLNMSWPWALLGPRFWINVVILVKVTVGIGFFCFFAKIEGKFTGVIYYRRLFSKKAAKKFCLFFKSVTYFFQWKSWGIQLIVLLFNNDSNID